MAADRRARLIAGSALILLGLALWWWHVTAGIDQGAVFFVVGGVFLAAYLSTRNYGYLVPGGIMLGMGAGMAGEGTFFDFGRSQMLGLGLGFVAIYVIALLYERKSAWWPLIPGGVLILLGIPDADEIFAFLWSNWPLILVIAGVLVLLGAFGRSKGKAKPAG